METRESNVTPKPNRIAELARKYRDEPLKSIHQFMDRWWLEDAFHQLDAKKAPGIDQVTKDQYGEKLAENLEDLIKRVRSRTYRAPAVKRVEIPKPGSDELRPLGIPSFEDKVLQKAFVMLVEPVFEDMFYGFSYGFRPGKSQHQAIESLFKGLGWDGKWVIDLDIRKFFDTIDHRHMREFFSKRITDGVLNRLVLGWLKAGSVQDGRWKASDEGTPQGGNVSPLLANLYLHEVLDDWFAKEVQPRMKGNSGMVRYADDAVLYFDRKEDAERVMKVLHKRLEKFGLQMHPEKTRFIDFTKAGAWDRKSSFNFLGFTFYWGKSRQGKPVIKLKTERKRKAAKKTALTRWIKGNRHLPRREQHQALSAKLRGLYQYYGVSDNISMMLSLLRHVKITWRKWLNRTGRKKPMNWKKFNFYLAANPMPSPKVYHRLY